MADTPIDKLIFQLGGDVSALQAAYKQAEDGAKRTGTAIQQNLGKSFQDAAKGIAGDSSNIDSALAKTSGHAKQLSEHIQVSRREMVYFFRELASGDLQRLPATMALFLSHLLEISPLALAGAAGLAALPVGLIIAAAKADAALAKLRTSIILTKNASGISLSEASGLSGQVAASGHISTMGAERIMGGLMGGGMPASLLGGATAAAGNYGLATGTSEEDAKSMMLRMFTDPVKSAEELNSSMHLLTLSQTEQIKNLTATGQQEKAAAIILGEFSQRASDAANAAGFWTKTWNSLGTFIGNVGHVLAIGAGGGSPAEQLKHLQEVNQQYKTDNPFMGGDMPGFRENAKRLQDQIDAEAKQAKIRGAAARDNALLSQTWTEASAGSNKFAMHIIDLKNKMELAGNAAKTAADDLKTHTNSVKAGDVTIFERNAKAAESVFKATQQYGQPGMAEERELANRRQLARTPQEKQSQVREQQEARERYIEELQNPDSTLDAEKNYRTRMATASINLGQVNKAEEQQRRLEAMKLESVAAQKMAESYDTLGGARKRAHVEAEVDVEITKKNIALKDRETAIQYSLSQAIDETRQALGKEIEQLQFAATGLGYELAAGGDPLAEMHAKARAQAYEKTEDDLRGAAGDHDREADILRQRRALEDSFYGQAQGEAQKGMQGTRNDALKNYQMQQRYAAAQGSGASEDDLRHLKIRNDLEIEFNKQGLDPAIQKNQELFQQLLQVNTATSDLADAMQKAQQEAQGLANDITGGLDQMLKSGSKDAWKQSGQLGLNMLDTIVKTNILEPMNKWLTSQFSGLIGGGQLGSSAGNPMYVQVTGSGPIPGTFTGGSTGIPGVGGGTSPADDTSFFGANGQLAQWLGTAPGGSIAAPSSAVPGAGDLSNSLDSQISGQALNGLGSLFGSSSAIAPEAISSTFADSAVAADAASSVGDLSSLAATPALADLGSAAAGSGGIMDALSSILAFAGFFDQGGTIGPGQWGIKSGMPEIIQGGTSGVSVQPLLGPDAAGTASQAFAPTVQAAIGSRLGGSAGGGNTIGDMYFNLPNVTDPQSFIRSKSQLAAAVTRATSSGRRNN